MPALWVGHNLVTWFCIQDTAEHSTLHEWSHCKFKQTDVLRFSSYFSQQHDGNGYISLSIFFSFKWICISFPIMSNQLYNPSQSCPILNQHWAAPFFMLVNCQKWLLGLPKHYFILSVLLGSLPWNQWNCLMTLSFIIISLYKPWSSLWSSNSFYMSHCESVFLRSLFTHLFLLFICQCTALSF